MLLVAVAVLFYLQFSGDKKATPSTVDHNAIDSISRNLTIAYVNYDTILANFKMVDVLEQEVKDKQAELDKKYENRSLALQNSFQSKAKEFQKNVQEYDSKAAELGEFKMKQAIMVLKEQEADLQEMQMSAENELADLESRYAKEVMDLQLKNSEILQNTMHDFLNRYNEEHNFSLILAMAQGSNLLHANNSLNITEDIINGLNAEYEEKLKDTKKE